MAVIKITSFGGEMPSVSSRNLPPGAARSSTNLNPRVNDFAPLYSDTVKATQASQIAAGKTFDPNGQFLYRFKTDGSGNPLANDTLGWRTNDTPLNYVSGQVNDLRTERVYISTLDGRYPPRVVDALGVNKPLGIDPPAAAPAVVRNKVNEYTVDEDTAARYRLPMDIASAMTTAFGGATLLGTAPNPALPTPSAAGWMSHAAANGVVTPRVTRSDADYMFMVPMELSGSSYKIKDIKDSYLSGVGFHGSEVVYGGGHYWAIPITVKGVGYVPSQSVLEAQLRLIKHADATLAGLTPSEMAALPEYAGNSYTHNGQLIPDGNITANALALMAPWLTSASPQSDSLLSQERAMYALATAHENAKNASEQIARYKAFFALSDVNLEIAQAIGNLSSRVYYAMVDLLGADRAVGATLNAGTVQTMVGTIGGAYIKYGFDGQLVIQSEKLWYDISVLMVADVAQTSLPAATKDYRNGEAVKRIDPLVDQFKAKLSASNWAPRADWPGNSGSSQTISQETAAAVADAIRAVESAAAAITQNYIALAGAQEKKVAGIFDADVAPYLSTPVTRQIRNCFYLTTLVSTWGEESAPSPVSVMLELDQSDTATVPRPAELSNAAKVAERLLAGWRIYRSNSGSLDTAFQLVADLGLVDATFLDDVPSAELGEVIPTLTWLPPPVAEQPPGAVIATPYLAGLCAMANGITAGFNGNTVSFSPPYIPYAYPIEHDVTTKYRVVGMASFGQTLFVGTTGAPVFVSGSDPASMSVQELAVQQSCSSARSIVPVDGGVIYASPDGLCLATLSGIKVITEGLFTKADWQSLNPSSIVAAMYDGAYYFLYNNREVTSADVLGLGWSNPVVTPDNLRALFQGIKDMIWNGNELQARAIYKDKQATYGFTDATFAAYTPFNTTEIGQWKNNTMLADPHRVGGWGSLVVRPSGCYSLDFAAGKLTQLDIKGTAFYQDETTDTLYVLDDTNIKALFANRAQRRAGSYWTGVVRLDKPEPMAWLQVDCDGGNPVKVHWYADKELRHTATVQSNQPVRLPSGRYLEHQVVVESVDRVNSVTLAGSTLEIQSV